MWDERIADQVERQQSLISNHCPNTRQEFPKKLRQVRMKRERDDDFTHLEILWLSVCFLSKGVCNNEILLLTNYQDPLTLTHHNSRQD